MMTSLMQLSIHEGLDLPLPFAPCLVIFRVLPVKFAEVKASGDSGFYDGEVRRNVEVPGSEKTMMADM